MAGLESSYSDIESESAVSHLTSAVCEHEAAFTIQKRYRDHRAHSRPIEFLAAHPQPVQHSARRVLVFMCLAATALLLVSFHTLLVSPPPPPPPPLLPPRDYAEVFFKGLVGGAASGAVAGAGVGLWFPWAMPAEAAFGSLVGGVVGGLQALQGLTHHEQSEVDRWSSRLEPARLVAWVMASDFVTAGLAKAYT
jgi:hypothetical protein